VKARKFYPFTGIFAVRGGLASTHFLTEADRGWYRYVTPAGRHISNSWVADCWLVDREGHINPGTAVSPVPIQREALGRRICVGGVR